MRLELRITPRRPPRRPSSSFFIKLAEPSLLLLVVFLLDFFDDLRFMSVGDLSSFIFLRRLLEDLGDFLLEEDLLPVFGFELLRLPPGDPEEDGEDAAKGGVRLGDPFDPLAVFRFLGVVVSVGDLDGDFFDGDLEGDDNEEEDPRFLPFGLSCLLS